jgi:hypothetical protein
VTVDGAQVDRPARRLRLLITALTTNVRNDVVTPDIAGDFPAHTAA